MPFGEKLHSALGKIPASLKYVILLVDDDFHSHSVSLDLTLPSQFFLLLFSYGFKTGSTDQSLCPHF